MKTIPTLCPLAALVALLLSVPAAAAPFAQWFDVALPDGSAARVWGEGDETAKADVLAALPAGDLYDTSDAHVAEVAAKAEEWDEAMGISKSWEELKEKNERARAAGAEGPLRTQTTVGTMVGPDVHRHRPRRGGHAVRRHPRRRLREPPAGPVRRSVAVPLIPPILWGERSDPTGRGFGGMIE